KKKIKLEKKEKKDKKDKKDKRDKKDKKDRKDKKENKIKIKKEKEEPEHIWKWWEEPELEAGTKWRSLEHKGPVLAPDYEPLPNHVKFYYDSKPVKLSPEAEEVAGFYARMLDHDYTKKKEFNDNFFKDWRKTMNKTERALITDLKKCDFREMDLYFKEESEKRKNRSKEEKVKEKEQAEKVAAEYGFCIVDGHKQKIGNFKIEPPGLFRGRGEHPKMGKLKKRIQPEDIIINIGKGVPIPKPPPGHKWKEVRHDNTVSWLASWTENIMNSVKYIMLNPSSKAKSQKDYQKYEKARELKKHINKIREDYKRDFSAKEMVVRQRAVALYFIDRLALRAGNEKDEDQADTVGCCSLRIEHIELSTEIDDDNDQSLTDSPKEKDLDDDKKLKYMVSFDFLGKDSIRYENKVAVKKKVYKNLQKFMHGKRPSDELFDRLNTVSLNKYLNSLMDGLTAKVFRTYNASKTLQDELDQRTNAKMTMAEKILAYNRANRAVAVLCNHQRAPPKTHEKQMENLDQKITEKEKQLKAAKKELKQAKSEKDSKAKEKLTKRINQINDQLHKLDIQKKDKAENKTIALGTSKLNYLDPRISVAWCKKYDVPIDKIYNKTQREKFQWAIAMATPDYKF
ncbi:DNA topoisomerase 1, partial [Fragariocoptes setiger]